MPGKDQTDENLSSFHDNNNADAKVNAKNENGPIDLEDLIGESSENELDQIDFALEEEPRANESAIESSDKDDSEEITLDDSDFLDFDEKPDLTRASSAFVEQGLNSSDDEPLSLDSDATNKEQDGDLIDFNFDDLDSDQSDASKNHSESVDSDESLELDDSLELDLESELETFDELPVVEEPGASKNDSTNKEEIEQLTEFEETPLDIISEDKFVLDEESDNLSKDDKDKDSDEVLDLVFEENGDGQVDDLEELPLVDDDPEQELTLDEAFDENLSTDKPIELEVSDDNDLLTDITAIEEEPVEIIEESIDELVLDEEVEVPEDKPIELDMPDETDILEDLPVLEDEPVEIEDTISPDHSEQSALDAEIAQMEISDFKKSVLDIEGPDLDDELLSEETGLSVDTPGIPESDVPTQKQDQPPAADIDIIDDDFDLDIKSDTFDESDGSSDLELGIDTSAVEQNSQEDHEVSTTSDTMAQNSTDTDDLGLDQPESSQTLDLNLSEPRRDDEGKIPALPEEVPIEDDIITTETLSITDQQIEKAIERVVKQMLGDKIDQMLIKIMETEVSKEIRRIKNLILENNPDTDG